MAVAVCRRRVGVDRETELSSALVELLQLETEAVNVRVVLDRELDQKSAGVIRASKRDSGYETGVST